MIDPISLTTLIVTGVTSLIGAMVGLFSAFKHGHFKSNCCDCWTVDMGDDPK